MPRILTAAAGASYRITTILSSPVTIVVAMSAGRSVKRRPRRREATPARALALPYKLFPERIISLNVGFREQ